MRRMLTAVPLLLLAVLAACGGGGEDGPGVATAGNAATASASADPSAPAADEEERKRQFTECMRAEGIELHEDRESGAIRAEKREMNAAMEKCRKYLPDGGEPPELSPEDIEKMRQYAQCMRQNGLPDFPDPDPETGNFRGGDFEKKDLDAADEKCRDKLPKIQKGGGR